MAAPAHAAELCDHASLAPAGGVIAIRCHTEAALRLTTRGDIVCEMIHARVLQSGRAVTIMEAEIVIND